MHRKLLLYLLPIPMALVAAGTTTWKEKPIPEWTDEDAKQLLAESPWVKTAYPSIERQASQRGRPRGIGGGPGIGIGLPGGMGRRFPRYPGGGGYPGGSGGGRYPGGGRGGDEKAPELKLRWESALPVREAELKAKDTTAPSIDPKYYAVAVYGVPERFLNGSDKHIADQLKSHAALKRDGKKDVKPASVEVLHKDNSAILVYLFPRSKEITRQDKRVEFNAKVFRLQFFESFYPEEMVFQNKLEL